MVRPLGTVDPADEENIARLGWLKVADDECFQPQTDDEVPLLEPGLPFSAVSTDGKHFRCRVSGLITSLNSLTESTAGCRR